MSINRKELKKIIYDFNSISNRLLRAEYDEVDSVLIKFLSFIQNNDLIFDYIKDCGKPTYVVEQEVKEVSNSYGRAIFELGTTVEEEITNIYHILKFCSENNKSIINLGRSYTSSTKYNDMVKCFGERVIMVLIRHIEGFLTKIGIDMDMNENIKYEITVNNGQVNLATDNATVNATQNNGIDKDELKLLIENIKRETPSLSKPEDVQTATESIEVIESELMEATPRKSFIRTALNGLKNIKGTVEFVSAVAALVQFVQTFF